MPTLFANRGVPPSAVPGVRSTLPAALVAALLLLVSLLSAGPAHAARPEPEEGKPLLGAVLEWGEDSAAGFAERLGASPALLDHEISLPVRSGEEQNVRDFFGQAAGQGAHAMLTVRPSMALGQVDAAAARAFAAKAKELASTFRGKLLIRFAPDMNSSWVAWGQQPAAYKEAFRTIAAEFKTADDAGTVMVWQPYLGRDYPFERHRDAPAA
ncbi:MAG: OpgC domain-containing protein, partial [Cellulosimicrobium cellulans]